MLLDRAPAEAAPQAGGLAGEEHVRVQRLLTRMAAAEPHRYVVVDADGSPTRWPSGSSRGAASRCCRSRPARPPARPPAEGGGAVTVWDEVVGQPAAVAELRAAAANPAAMTHAWLFTGPPGSGRSVAARAFAAALQCPRHGCGDCAACHTVMAGTHSDVREVVPEGLSISVRSMRLLVQLAARRPATGRYQILIITDADRLTENAANALLKAVEEPPAQTIFLLCAPSDHPDDVAVTIRSRCRLVPLRTPSADAIADVLVRRDGIDPETAGWAASVAAATSGGPATWPATRTPAPTGRPVLGLPLRMRGLGDAFAYAGDLVRAAKAEATELSESRDAAEREELAVAMGAGGTGKGVAAAARGAKAAERELERQQKSRNTRTQRDAHRPRPRRPRRVLPRHARGGQRGAGAADQPGPRGRRPPGRHRLAARSRCCAGWRPCWPAAPRSTRTSSRRSPSRR